MRVRIIGLGAIGSRLALHARQAGCDVLGVDIRHDLIDDLRAGRGDAIGQQLARLIGDGVDIAHPTVSTNLKFDATFVCVTSWDKEVGLSADRLIEALSALGASISHGETILIESSVPPGTTQNEAREALEESSGLVAGRDFYLASAPERTDVSIPTSTTATRVVGGVTNACTERAKSVYQRLGIQVVKVTNATVAEACKLLENSFRLVNVSFANEAAEIFAGLGIDPREVVEAASTKPFGFMPFWPSAGAGGHCVPAAGRALEELAGRVGVGARITSAANRENASSPARVQRDLERAGLLPGDEVLVLGCAYKSYVEEDCESPGLRIVDHLRAQGYAVTACDSTIRTHIDGIAIKDPSMIVGTRFKATCVTTWQEDFVALGLKVDLGRVHDYCGDGDNLFISQAGTVSAWSA